MIEFLKNLARQAGAIALADGLHLHSANIHTKATARDLVTDTDRKVERFIIDELEKRFPEYGIYGEERFLYNFTFYNFFEGDELNDMCFLVAKPA